MTAPRPRVARGQACALCKGQVNDIDFCYGCREFICSKCERPDPDAVPQGAKHTADAHRVKEN